MDKATRISISGFTRISEGEENREITQPLQDGLSYLIYSLRGNDVGTGSKRTDMKIAISFVEEALAAMKESQNKKEK